MGSTSWRTAAAWVALVAGAASAAENEWPALALEDALQPPIVRRVEISPDGRHVAAIGSRGDLLLIRTDDLSNRIILRSKSEEDGFYIYYKVPRRVTWINNELLGVDLGLVAEAYDLDGKRIAKLGTRIIRKAEPRAADSTRMLVFEDEKFRRIGVVDVRTKDSQSIRYPMAGELERAVFDERGRLRAVTMSESAFWRDDTTLSHWYLPLGGSDWIKLADFKLGDETWTPMSASATQDDLIVAARHERDTLALFHYDPLQRRFGALVAGHPNEDVVDADDDQVEDANSIVTHGMKPVRRWFDVKWANLQASVDAALPGRINMLSGDPDGNVLIHSYADVDPGRWLLLDTRRNKIVPLFAVRPAVDPAKMRPVSVMSYRAADGLEIPAYLTLPAGAPGPRPTVVLVHGGPTVRDDWRWDAEVQILATRGYVVFQPQFRGSAGFGKAFQRAGYGQWGLAMQDDVTAGVEHLVRSGIADPRRICIYGASYGGYAAVWGLAKTPELYRCGITLAGISDVAYALSDWSDRNFNKEVRQLQRFTVGDRERDAAKFDAVSPLRHAGRIRAPLLVSHGDEDRRVPIAHSKKLMSALDDQRKPYEWLPLRNQGHWPEPWALLKFWNAALPFLDKHIGPAAGTAP